MKKVFAVIALLAVSLTFMTACSSAIYVEDSFDYEKSDYSLTYTFSIRVSDKNAEYFNYDLKIYGENDEVFDALYYKKKALGEKDENGNYTFSYQYNYPAELDGHPEKIVKVIVENFSVWSFDGPKITFILVTVTASLMILILTLVAVAGKRKRNSSEDGSSQESNN